MCRYIYIYICTYIFMNAFKCSLTHSQLVPKHIQIISKSCLTHFQNITQTPPSQVMHQSCLNHT